MLTIVSSQFDQIVQTIKYLFAVSMLLLIVYVILKLFLAFFQRKNYIKSLEFEKIVEGQVGYVFQYIYPNKQGYIVCETEEGIQFAKAEADVEIEEGTAVVVISCQENICRIKPLVTRINPG